MTDFKKIKTASSKIKEVTLTLLFTASLLGVAFSSNANAAENTMTNQVSEYIAKQGEVMLVELNTQLQKSINHQVNTLAVNFSRDNAMASSTNKRALDHTTVEKLIKTKNDIHK